jgi:signal transduction histidine kinase
MVDVAMHFRFSPEVLSRLGEELIPNPEQGIIELVKNSYDADATWCRVELRERETGSRSFLVIDDGLGMDADAISNGWLVIGRSGKATRQPTRKFNRLPVGDKGLGRLSALRQGRKVVLETTPDREPNALYALEIDWDRLQRASTVEDVELNVKKQVSNGEGHGTKIAVEDLRSELGRVALKRLAREMLLLADPFGNNLGFRPVLVAPDFTELEKRVQQGYREDAEYYLHARLDDNGHATVQLQDWKGKVLSSAAHEELSSEPYRTVAARFELWVFILSNKANAFSAKNITVEEVRNWLSVVGGVHLYHRGLRVRPYGDEGHDWLEMNLARVRSPEVRPSTNTSIGRVVVEDPGDVLIQKTDRTGFVETDAFLELRRFASDALRWMADHRLREAEERRKHERETARRSTEQAKSEFNKVVHESVPKQERPRVKKAIESYEKARDRESDTLRKDLQLYRSVATTGAVSARFAHESGKTITRIGTLMNTIEKKGRELLDGNYDEFLKKPVNLIRKSVATMENYASLSLRLLRQSKRRSGAVDVHGVIDEMLELFGPFLSEAKIEAKVEKADTDPRVFGSVALLDAVLANFLINSINAFTRVDGARLEDRKVVIRTEITSDRLLLRFMDNGLGIINIGTDEIWLPGRTTLEDGTGLGLVIVKDSVADLGGEATAVAHGELGGAEFIVNTPLLPYSQGSRE